MAFEFVTVKCEPESEYFSDEAEDSLPSEMMTAEQSYNSHPEDPLSTVTTIYEDSNDCNSSQPDEPLITELLVKPTEELINPKLEIEEVIIKPEISEEDGDNTEDSNDTNLFYPAESMTVPMDPTFMRVPQIKRFKCRVCNIVFFKRGLLRKHIRTVHNGVKPYTCFVCNAHFLVKSDLGIHMDTTHQGPKKYSCSYCNKMFIQSSDRNKHVACVHEGIRIYACHLCDKRFSERGNLNKHLSNIHEGLRQYSCAICNKTFNLKCNLKRHMDTVHGQVKKHTCTFCNRTFSQEGNLNRHIYIVHEGHSKKRVRYGACTNDPRKLIVPDIISD